MLQSRYRNLFIYLLLMVAIVGIYSSFRSSDSQSNRSITMSELANQIKSGAPIYNLVVRQNQIQVNYTTTSEYSVVWKESSSSLVDQLQSLGVPPAQLASIRVIYTNENPTLNSILIIFISALPLLLSAGLAYLFLHRRRKAKSVHPRS
jgi:ATP-dependent Zn protease